MKTYEVRYSLHGVDRAARACSHLVDNEIEKSLCGKDARDWFKMDDTSAPECLICKAKIEILFGEKDINSSPRICIVCGMVRKDNQSRRVCSACKGKKQYHRNPEVHRERIRQRRKDPVEMAKTLARNALYAAIKNGKIRRQPCEVCGDPKVHGHHDDYSKRLEVRWLCSVHHAQVHKELSNA